MGSTWSRRIVTVPATFLVAVLLVIAAPIAVPLLTVVDVMRGRLRIPLVRSWLFATAYALLESAMLVVVAGLWVLSGFGLFMRTEWCRHLHRLLQRWWIDRLITLLRSLLGLRFTIGGADEIRPGPVIVFGRHASLVDTLFPALALTDSGLRLRYVLKRELEIVPLLDIVGHRLPNYFADRSGTDTDRELSALSRLATGLGPDDSVVIFPEGTRGTPAKRERAVERLREHHPDLAARAEGLRHTMPPRWGGPGALLDAAPEADVVVFVHHGLDGMRDLPSIIAGLPFRHPVEVELWRIPRDEIPDDAEARRRWLFDLWERVDDWVEQRAVSRS